MPPKQRAPLNLPRHVAAALGDAEAAYRVARPTRSFSSGYKTAFAEAWTRIDPHATHQLVFKDAMNFADDMTSRGFDSWDLSAREVVYLAAAFARGPLTIRQFAVESERAARCDPPTLPPVSADDDTSFNRRCTDALRVACGYFTANSGHLLTYASRYFVDFEAVWRSLDPLLLGRFVHIRQVQALAHLLTERGWRDWGDARRELSISKELLRHCHEVTLPQLAEISENYDFNLEAHTGVPTPDFTVAPPRARNLVPTPPLSSLGLDTPSSATWIGDALPDVTPVADDDDDDDQEPKPTASPPSSSGEAKSRTVNQPPDTDELKCVVCYDGRKAVLMLPCRHLALCTRCAQAPEMDCRTCLICRAPVASMLEVFV